MYKTHIWSEHSTQKLSRAERGMQGFHENYWRLSVHCSRFSQHYWSSFFLANAKRKNERKKERRDEKSNFHPHILTLLPHYRAANKRQSILRAYTQHSSIVPFNPFTLRVNVKRLIQWRFRVMTVIMIRTLFNELSFVLLFFFMLPRRSTTCSTLQQCFSRVLKRASEGMTLAIRWWNVVYRKKPSEQHNSRNMSTRTR